MTVRGRRSCRRCLARSELALPCARFQGCSSRRSSSTARLPRAACGGRPVPSSERAGQRARGSAASGCRGQARGVSWRSIGLRLRGFDDLVEVRVVVDARPRLQAPSRSGPCPTVVPTFSPEEVDQVRHRPAPGATPTRCRSGRRSVEASWPANRARPGPPCEWPRTAKPGEALRLVRGGARRGRRRARSSPRKRRPDKGAARPCRAPDSRTRRSRSRRAAVRRRLRRGPVDPSPSPGKGRSYSPLQPCRAHTRSLFCRRWAARRQVRR